MATNISTIETAIKTGLSNIGNAVKVRNAATETIGVNQLMVLIQTAGWRRLNDVPTGGKGSRPVITAAKAKLQSKTGASDATLKRYWEKARAIEMDKVLGPISDDPAKVAAQCKLLSFKTPKGVEKTGVETFKDMEHYLGLFEVKSESERIAELAAQLGCKTVAEFVTMAEKPAVAKALSKILKDRAAKAKAADAKAKARDAAKATKAKAAPKKAAKKAA